MVNPKKYKKSLISGIKWHGSQDISWIDKCENFTPKIHRNAPSKYMFLAQNKGTAENYASTSENAIEKAKLGLGKYPKDSAGVRPFNITNDAKVYYIDNIVKVSNQFGIDFNNISDFENTLDKIKEQGYDIAIIGQDANNIVVLNDKKITNIHCKKN